MSLSVGFRIRTPRISVLLCVIMNNSWTNCIVIQVLVSPLIPVNPTELRPIRQSLYHGLDTWLRERTKYKEETIQWEFPPKLFVA